jgi:hypothetical protein
MPSEDEEDASLAQMPAVAPARKPAPSVKAKPFATQNVLSLAKARRRDVKKELSRLKALQKELAELDRLIDAAAGKPRLVAIKRNAG